MVFLSLLWVFAAAEPDDGLARKMLPIYRKEAAAYSIAVETAPGKELELRKEPIYEWTNPVRSTLQQGVIFLWLRDGRPAALANIYSQPEGSPKGHRIIHELHALDREKLLVSRPSGALNEWKPQAGLERKELPDAGTPAATAEARLVQMRRLAREFSGYEVDANGKRLDLRLLPSPLYRYPAAGSGMVDGALFALVSTSGTDPEVLLLIEAHEKDNKIRWEYACGRFSDRSLYMQRKDREVWSMVRDENNIFLHDPQHLYRTYADKVVSLDGKLLARVRATPKVWWGEFYPVNEK
jgi:hypothetical protein